MTLALTAAPTTHRGYVRNLPNAATEQITTILDSSLSRTGLRFWRLTTKSGRTVEIHVDDDGNVETMVIGLHRQSALWRIAATDCTQLDAESIMVDTKSGLIEPGYSGVITCIYMHNGSSTGMPLAGLIEIVLDFMDLDSVASAEFCFEPDRRHSPLVFSVTVGRV